MISPEVIQELLSIRQVLHYLPVSPSTEKGWTSEESQLFWVALAKYPHGPWTTIAEYIGTKTTRQAMTHGQKLRQKFKRWNKRLRRNPIASSLMDGITATPMEVSSGVPMTPSTSGGRERSTMKAVEPYTLQGEYLDSSSPSLSSNPHCSVVVGDVSIMSEEKVDGNNNFPQAATTAAPAYLLTADATRQRTHYPAAALTLPSLWPGSSDSVRSTLPAIPSEDTPTMQSGAEADTWVVSDFTDDAEILPQELLNELTDMLWDEDLDERVHGRESDEHC